MGWKECRGKSNTLFPLKSSALILRMILVKGESQVYLGILVQFFGQSEITRVEWNRRHPLSTLTAARVTPVGGKGVHGAASNDLSAAACETSSTGRGNQFFLASELNPCCVFNTRRDPFKKMTTCRHDSPCAKGLHCLFPWVVNVFEIGLSRWSSW